MTHKKTEVAKKLKSLPDLLGAINAYYDCSTGLDMKPRLQDAQLRQNIKEAKTQDDIIELLTTAAAEKGDNFTTEEVLQILAAPKQDGNGIAPGKDDSY